MSKMIGYLNPGAIQIALIEPGDDLLHEIPSRTEVSSLTEKQRRRLLRRFSFINTRSNVQNCLQIAINPIISSHYAPRFVSPVPPSKKKKNWKIREERKMKTIYMCGSVQNLRLRSWKMVKFWQSRTEKDDEIRNWMSFSSPVSALKAPPL